MALFKISKGKKANLPTTKTEGFCWFTTDDGKFYIDIDNSTRQILNAGHADTATKAETADYADEAGHANSATIAENATEAGKAIKLKTPRTISLTGDVEGSASFDGSTNISISAELTDTGVNPASYGPMEGFTLTHGGNFTVPQITVDVDGRITAASTKTFRMPTDNNTDTKVVQKAVSDNAEFPVVLPYNNNPTSGTAQEVQYTTGVTINPASKTVTASQFKGALVGNVTGNVTGNLIGNAETADYADEAGHANSATTASAATEAEKAIKLKTPRTISLTGDIEGSASFDGSTNISITAELTDTGVSAGTYGPTDNASPAAGGTFSVPSFEVDVDGRVVAASSKTITLPADKNTDTKVTQSAAITTSAEYPVILGYSTSTSSVTNTVNKTSTLKYNPGTQTLTAPKLKGNLTGNVTGNVTGNLIGNADSADYAAEAGHANSATVAENATSANEAAKLGIARTIALTGDVEGSAAFDGSANISISAELVNTGVIAGTYGDDNSASPGFGGTINVPQFTVDEDGRITAASEKTISFPANIDNNTAHSHSSGAGLVLTGAGGINGDVSYALETLSTSGIKTGLSSSQSPAHGGTFNIPSVEVDKHGRVTALGTTTVKLPTDKDTNTAHNHIDSNCITVASTTTGGISGDVSLDLKTLTTSGIKTTLSAQTPGYNSTFNIPSVEVDKYGRVTKLGTTTVKIPASDNVDTNTAHNHSAIDDTLDVSGEGGINGTVSYGLKALTSDAISTNLSAQTPAHGGTFNIPTVTADKYGRVTGFGTTTVKLPTDKDTNTAHSHSATDGLYVTGSGNTISGTVTYGLSTLSTNGIKTTLTAQTPGYGSNFNIPSVEVDKYGRVTSLGTTTVKIPASDNVNTAHDHTVIDDTLDISEDVGGISGTVGYGLKALTTSGINTGLSAQTPGHSSAFNIPSVEVDKYGRVTSLGTTTVTLPADKNTDTKNTAGATNSTSKIYLVGATAQNASPQTYTNSSVFVSGSNVYSNGKQTLTGVGTAGTASTAPGHNGSFNVVTGITTSGANIIPTITTVTLPADNNTNTSHTHEVIDDTLALEGAGGINGAVKYGLKEIYAEEGISTTVPATQTPGHGASFSVPSVHVDKYGRVESFGTTTVTLPTDKDTNTAHTHSAADGLYVSGSGNSISGTVTYGLSTVTTSGIKTTLTSQTPGYNSTFNIPSIEVDKYGRVTKLGTTTVKIPASDNVDTNTAHTHSSSETLDVDGVGGISGNVSYNMKTLTSAGINTEINAKQTPSHGGAFDIPSVTVDKYGRVTGLGKTTVQLPTDSNTDTKVTQNAATTAAGEYPVILGYNTSTSSVTNTVNKTSSLLYNPSTQILTAPKFSGSLIGNADTATSASKDMQGNVISETYETIENTALMVATALAEAKTYAKNELDVGDALTLAAACQYIEDAKEELLGGAEESYNTLKELKEFIDNNEDAIETIQAVTTAKQDKITSLKLTGDTTGTATINGGVITISTDLTDTGVTAGTYGLTTSATPNYGGTFNVPSFTVDAEGRITSASTKTVKIPASDNVDTNTAHTHTAGSALVATGTGGITGEVSYDMVELHGSAGINTGLSAQTPGHNSTFDIPSVTVDKYGRVTSLGKTTVKLPVDNDTDTKNTAGATTTTSKIFLVGATTSGTYKQTYISASAFVSGGNVYSNSKQTLTGVGTATTGTAAPTHGGTIDVVTGITTNGANIIPTVTTVTLPPDNNTNTAHTHGVIDDTLNMSGSGGISGATSYGLKAIHTTTGINTGITAEQTPGHTETFEIPSVEVDQYGRVTSLGKTTVKLPSDNNSNTKNTAGATNSTSKLFLVGATTQAASPQTYTNSSAYVSGNCLYSNNKITLTGVGTAGTASTAPNAGGQISVVTGISTSGANIIPTVTTITLPADKDTNTAHTHTVIDDTLDISGSGGINGAVGYGLKALTSSNTSTGLAAQTPGHNSTFSIPSVEVDKYGRVIGLGTTTVKLPADSNTDTKNTAGATNSTSKLFLVGATAQNASPQTYTNSNAYVTNGNVYSNGKQTLTGVGTATTGSAAPGHGGSFTVITGITTNGANIIPTLTTVTLPADKDTNTAHTHGVIDDTLDISGSGGISGTTNYGLKALTTSGISTGLTAQTPGYASTFNIPSVTVDKYGRVTGLGTTTVKIPASDNTDTKNTAGATNSTSKLFLVGATAQNASPQTYTNSSAYVTNGNVYSNNKQTLTGVGTATTGTTAPGHSGSFTVVTGITTSGANIIPTLTTVTLPSDNNTDTKVTQAAAITTNANYPVILGYSSATTAVTNTVNKTSTLKYNPSTQTLTAPKIVGDVTGNLTGSASKLGDYSPEAFARLAAANIFTQPQTISQGGNPYVALNNSSDSKKAYIQIYDQNGTAESQLALGFGWANSVKIDQAGNVTLINGKNITTSPVDNETPTFVGLASSAIADRYGNVIDETYATKSALTSAVNTIPTITASSTKTSGNALGNITINGVTTTYYETPNPTSFNIAASATGDDIITLTGSGGANKVNYTASHKLGTAYTAGNTTTSVGGSYGSSTKFKIPQITTDKYGHVTAASDEEITITMPAAQDVSKFFNKKDGDTISGKIGITQDVNYGTTLPTSPIAGELFFKEENIQGITLAASTAKRYICGVSGSGSNKTTVNYNTGVYTSGSVLYGAAWNDYAEYREAREEEIPYGRVVVENGDDTLSVSTERLQPGGNVCSDTFGFAIGETEKAKMPIAVSGRALVFPNEDRNSYKPGDAVCTGPNGTVSKMTREEIKEYPDRIIGYVSAVPNYGVWGENNVLVKGRIWIKIV